MQNVGGKTELARVLVFETSPERAMLITDRLLDHGIEAVFVDDPEGLGRFLSERRFDVVLINDCLEDSHQTLAICSDLRRDFDSFAEIVLASDNTQLNLHECHKAGCAHVIHRALDFNELCDLVERIAQVSGKRLYDGQQLWLSRRLGESVQSLTKLKSACDISLQVEEVSRGGFYFEVDSDQASNFKEATLLDFELNLAMLPDTSFRGKGYVSWTQELSNGKVGIGVEFVAIPHDSENLLRAFSELFKIKEFIPIPMMTA